jgi:hypothetical protein
MKSYRAGTDSQKSVIERAIAKEREDCALICAAILNEDGWSDDGVERAIIAIREREVE